MISKLLLSLFTWFSLNTFSSRTDSFHCSLIYQAWYKHFKLIESSPQLNLVYPYITCVPQTIMYPVRQYIWQKNSNSQYNTWVNTEISVHIFTEWIFFKYFRLVFLSIKIELKCLSIFEKNSRDSVIRKRKSS